jgi:tetratricopeptide (TPR) repeat protein
MALMYQVQLSRLAGTFLSNGEDRLLEALELVKPEEQGDVLHDLGQWFHDKGELARAADCLERALQAHSVHFGEESREVGTCLHTLAGVLRAQGDLSGARARLERVLEIELKVYGTREHYSSAMTEESLGFLQMKSGDVEAGLERLVHAHGAYQRQLGGEHPHTRRLAAFLAGLSPDAASAE